MSAMIAGPRARRSLHVWGWYVGALGVVLNVSPNTLLSLFLLPPATEVWVRVRVDVAGALWTQWALARDARG